MALNNAINSATPNVTAHSILLSQGASPNTGVLLTTGQILVGVTGSDPVATTLSSETWTLLAGTTQTAVANTGYIIGNAAQTTITLPVSPAVGSVVAIAGSAVGVGGWILNAGAGQTIYIGNQATSVAGTLTSSNQYDCVKVVCVAALTWVVLNMMGNLTYA